jgi:hypothetical protein
MLNSCKNYKGEKMANLKYTIEDCYSLAKDRGLQFLSKTYLRANDKYWWKCSVPEHPKFQKSFSQIQHGQGCRKCRYAKASEKLRGKNQKTGEIVDINYIKEFARSKGGVCLSDKYKNNKTKLKFRCYCSNEWEVSWESVYNGGTWCPKCAGVSKDIEDCKEDARKWGGICLSRKYINSTTPLKYKCNNGHVFYMTPEQITAGTWCPECHSSIGERITRGIFTRIFRCDFDKVRPDSLRNEDGNRLELDGFNADYKLAFEYQGHQHEMFVKHFHKNQAEFEKRQRDDLKKKEWCHENGITLVEVPEFADFLNLSEIIKTVEECISQAGVTIPKYKMPKTHGEILHSDLSELKNICKKRGGKVITDAFLGWDSRHRFVCGAGHPWITTAESIKQGTWCRDCSMKKMGEEQRKYTLEDAKKLAKENNGKCLSKTDSFTSEDKLTWYCNVHQETWDAPISRIVKGGWCSKCGYEKGSMKRRKYTIKDLQNLAAERGGKCLSMEYINVSFKYKWECAKNHTWDASFSDIKGSPKHKPTWCPECAGKKKHTIEDMREWAAAHGGECLSTEYVNAKTPLLWRCSCGHEFWAAPTNIQRGKWCPKERGKKAWETRRKNMEKDK